MHRYLFFTLLIVGCSGGSVVKDDSMSADEHRAAAKEHHEQGGAHEGEAEAAVGTGTGDPVFGLASYDLDNYHNAEADRHHALAEQHEAAADRLEAFEEAQCSEFPKATRSRCPLMGTVASVNDIENGVEITLVDGVNVDAVSAHIECHHAFARTEGREGMDSCPMYVEGFSLERVGDTLRMTTSADHVDDLRKRSRAHLKP